MMFYPKDAVKQPADDQTKPAAADEAVNEEDAPLAGEGSGFFVDLAEQEG